MDGFDFTIMLKSGKSIRKSVLTGDEWFSMYGDSMIVKFAPMGSFSLRVCKPNVVSIVVHFRGQDYEFGPRVAKGQPYIIFLHNNARSMGTYEKPRHGESQQVFAKTVGIVLEDDKQIFQQEFHRNGKVIPSMRGYDSVRSVDAQL